MLVIAADTAGSDTCSCAAAARTLPASATATNVRIRDQVTGCSMAGA
ncbi:hypothetical protein TOK_4354 [Pseudonocardia sp. N23]|nr:hypothetical protein TOK_4354 [Pseudonocardia sp. N23]